MTIVRRYLLARTYGPYARSGLARRCFAVPVVTPFARGRPARGGRTPRANKNTTPRDFSPCAPRLYTECPLDAFKVLVMRVYTCVRLCVEWSAADVYTTDKV